MTFIPSVDTVSAVTKANPCVVTTSTDHGFVSGEAVRFYISPPYGMQQLNGKIFVITVLSSNTFSLQTTLVPYPVNVDSRNFDAFLSPSSVGTAPQVIAIGSLPIHAVSDRYFETRLDDQVVNVATINQPY